MMIICDTCVGIHIRIYNKEVLVMSASKDTKRGTWKVYIRYKDWQGVGQVHTKRGFATKREALEYEREFLLKKSKDVNMGFPQFVEVYMAAYKDEARGTWYVSFHYNDWTGKNKRKLKRGFRTRKEALEYEQKFLLQQATNLDMRFADFYKLYEEDLKPKLKLNTWRTKEVIFQKKLIPYFKDKKMNEISPADIIKWQNEMIKKRQADGKPYKPTYLKTMQSELSAIFNHAVRFYNLRENPVKKAGTIGKGKADEMDFWTKEEYLKFIECVKDKPISYYAFQILYWCGIREGELLALTPADIDFENKKLHITKSYGKLSIVQGDPGDGKSTLILNIAAKLSRGECIDENMNITEPVNVIYQTAEDGLADTVKPRLEAANADCSRISIIDESDKDSH